MSNQPWKQSLERFFYDRAVGIQGPPTLRDHCTVSAKDPRISANPAFHDDMIESIVAQMALDPSASVLEVGCASGYIACALAPRVARYTGVDLAATPLIVARKMGLTNAVFQQSDGADLPFPNDHFDGALAYDVFSNFPSFQLVQPLLAEMIRVVRPGGRVLAGSITEASKGEEFQQRVYEVAAKLEREHGPLVPTPVNTRPQGILARVKNRLKRTLERLPPPPAAAAQIVNYNFEVEDFRAFARSRALTVEINDVHALNPYVGYRFNVVFTKPA